MNKYFFHTLILNIFLLHTAKGESNSLEIDSTIHQKQVKQIDVKDIIKVIFSKDTTIKNANFKIVNKDKSFAVLPAFNYTIVTGFLFGVNTVQTFKTSADSLTKQSNIRTFTTYSQFKQFSTIINTNIWTKKNKLNVLGDYRFYKFPSTTYGLGGNTTFENANLVDYLHFRAYQVALRKISNGIDIGIGYHLDYHWKIRETNGDNIFVTDLQKYGLTANSISSGFSFNIQHDSRTNSSNPTGGSYANIQYRYNLKLLGSNQNWQSLVMDLRKYIHFPSNSKNIIAFWSYNWFTFAGNAPYFDLPSIGWDTYYNTGRGYPIGRFRGKNLVYLEGEYRFGITRNGLLGGVVFTNAQSVANYPNNGMSKIIPAFGGGIRLKWSKLTNTTIALDYGIGIGGSKGVVFNINEVF
ncbi:BamA/TamA family outer membrane protein [Emticicia sp. SJ17W-69]|uniref:BamA/TamA family outer membrane protein n=1 Tax=Emticicia sp. SJ17W-69 TaxID=3421657 RepID=UPI003EC0E998